MIIHGMIVLENGEWKEINFENELTKFNSHTEFAKHYIAINQELGSLYQEYSKEYAKFCLRENEKCIVDPVDFLMQYFGFIKIGLKIQETSRTILFYHQSPEYNESKIGKDRFSIINTYRARGFIEENGFNNEIPEFVYDMQKDNQFLKGLYSEQENIR